MSTVGFYSGIQLLINNTVGPALVLIPSLFQQFGYLPVILLLAIVSILSVISAWMLTETLRHYVTTTKHRSYSILEEDEQQEGITLYHVMQQYISNKYILKSILFIYVTALILRLMTAIIQSGQIIDLMIRESFSKTCAFGLSAQNISLICTNHSFDDKLYTLSFGFILLIIICFILFRNMNFDNIVDSLWLQWFANIVVTVLLFIWLYIFITENTFQTNRISLLYNNKNTHLSHVVSIICANYAFIVPVCSWWTQKDKNINDSLVMKTFIYSILFVFVLFILIGIFGGMAYTSQIYDKYGNNLFTVLNESEHAGVLGKLSIYMFPIAQNITTIPVLCIIIAYNIKNFGIEYKYSLIISSITPWILSLLFFNGDGFNQICDYTSIFITIINFILPPLMHMKMKIITNQIIDDYDQETAGFLQKTNDNRNVNLSNTNDILNKNAFIIGYSMMTLSVCLIVILIYDKFAH